jgi:hypothetical protein
LRMGGGVVRYKLLSLPKNRSGSGGSGSAGTFHLITFILLKQLSRRFHFSKTRHLFDENEIL